MVSTRRANARVRRTILDSLCLMVALQPLDERCVYYTLVTGFVTEPVNLFAFAFDDSTFNLAGRAAPYNA